jgi:hypothetical protein
MIIDILAIEQAEIPDSAFLRPATRQYKVREKRNDGKWHYAKFYIQWALKTAQAQGDTSAVADLNQLLKREFRVT